MMTKAELDMLAKLYSAEVEAALSHDPLRSVVQTKSKVMRKLVEEGFAKEVERTTPGRFPVRVKGYELTLQGNFAYCMSCGHDGDKSRE
jgi:hypothetical protein